MKEEQFIERRIITGLIISTDYITQIRKVWDSKLIGSATAKRIANWCIEFYDQYNEAPGQEIESIFIKKTKNDKKENIKGIEDVLADLSNEYERSDKFNVPYLIDQTIQYFDERGLRAFVEGLTDDLDEGDILQAKVNAMAYTALKSLEEKDLDLSNPDSLVKIERAFNITSQPVFKYARQLGQFLNDQLIRGGFIGLLAPEKRGKCLPGSQKIHLADGSLMVLKDVIKNEKRHIISFDESSQKFVKSYIDKFWQNGVKPVYKIMTKTGREVTVTKNHPFLTPDGWLDLHKIKQGDFIAVPKECSFFGTHKISDEIIKLLAYFITEGCLREYNYAGRKSKVIGFTSADKDIQNDFTNCIQKIGCDVSWYGIDARVINSKQNKRKHNKNYILPILKKYKLWNKLSYDKKIPVEIFKLSKSKLSLFLQVLFTCDGWVNKGKEKQIGFAVANKDLAFQVQMLLTKFGIVSKIVFSKNDKKGAWTVSIRDGENIIKFSNAIGFIFSKKEKMNGQLPNKINYRSFLDKFPYQIARKFHDEVEIELGGRPITAGGAYVNFSRFHKVFSKAPIVREQIVKKAPLMKQSFIEVAKTKTGKKYFNSSILWDQIMSIEFIGEEETFDLTVNKYHNFIAENIIVHNTYALLDMGMTAARQGANVAFFQAGDMTEDQQLKRICVYLAKKSDKEKYSGKMHEPVRDCIFNQLDTCNKKQRECEFGVFEDRDEDYLRKEITKEELIEAYKENQDYVTCHNCADYWKKKWGAIWLKEVNTGSPLDVNLAKKEVEKFFIKNNRRFKLSSHPTKTLKVSDINNILDLWEREDGFVADLILIDYADILAPEFSTDFRHQENEKWMAMRALSQKRHALVITPTQSDAGSYKNDTIQLDNFSEDKRKYAHVTAMYGLSQDRKGREKSLGIMRINEILIREGEYLTSNQVYVLQNLSRGQFALSSYW